MPIGETKRLLIDVLQHCDIENARVLHNDALTLMCLHDVGHITAAKQESWFEQLSRSASSFRYVIKTKKTNQFVGIFRSDKLDLKNGNVMIGLDIHSGQRGKKYAREIYEWFLDYYFNHLRIHRVYLEVLASNTLARSIYQKLGFIEEGYQREAVFREGKYIDSIMMGFLAHEYQKCFVETEPLSSQLSAKASP